MKKHVGLILVMLLFVNSLFFNVNAAVTPNESIKTSIYVDNNGATNTLEVINKNHELWKIGNNGNIELIMKDVSQVGQYDKSLTEFYNTKHGILKTDGSLWDLLPLSPPTPGSWESNVQREYKCLAQDLKDIPLTTYAHEQIKKLGIKNVKKVYSGFDCSFFIKEDGSLWGWGDNSKGQMGKGLIYDKINAWRIGSGEEHVISAFINVDKPVKIMDNVKELYLTWSTSWMQEGIFALKNDGSVWVWGDSTMVKYDTETQKIVKGLDEGKEYPRLAPDDFQNIKYLVVGEPIFAGYDELGNLKHKYSYLKVSNDNTLWVKGDFNDHNVPEFRQIPVESILGTD